MPRLTCSVVPNLEPPSPIDRIPIRNDELLKIQLKCKFHRCVCGVRTLHEVRQFEIIVITDNVIIHVVYFSSGLESRLETKASN